MRCILRCIKPEGDFVAKIVRKQVSIGSSATKDRSLWDEEKRFIRALMKRKGFNSKRNWKREDLYDRALSQTQAKPLDVLDVFLMTSFDPEEEVLEGATGNEHRS